MRLTTLIHLLPSALAFALATSTTLNSRWEMAVPRCMIKPTGTCMLGTAQWSSQTQASISVFDSNCKIIGFNGEATRPGIFGLDSQLPWVCVVEMYGGNTGDPDDNQADANGEFGYQSEVPTLWYAGSRYDTADCHGDGAGTFCMTTFAC